MALKHIVLVLLFIGCSYASPLRTAAVYGSPLFAVPVLVQDLDESATDAEEPTAYVLNDGIANFLDVKKRSIGETGDDADDLETAAGTNVLRPLFVYRQQVAYRQRVRNAIRRGRRI